MTTTTVPIQITCPEWCRVSPAEHAMALWDMGGQCIHSGSDVKVEDVTGFLTEPLAERRYEKPFVIRLTAATAPDGRPQATPEVELEGYRDLTFQQAVDLGASLCNQVLKYFETNDVPTVPQDGLLDQMVDLLDELRTAAVALGGKK